MKTASLNPDSVSMVNITPDAARSERTIRCTPADSATCSWANPWWTRYAMARSLNSEANTSRTASSTESMPRMFRKVSCWPAKEASGRSSAVAEERTATERSSPSPVSCAYAARMSASRSGGKGCATTAARIVAPTSASRRVSSTSRSASSAAIRSARPVSPRKRR